MKRDCVILIAEQNEEHLNLMKNGLLHAGVNNDIVHFADGRQTLDFLFDTTQKSDGELEGREYILFMDIDLPQVGGIEILEKIKADNMLSKVPVIVLAAADDPKIIDRCYDLGCCTYIVKPAEDEAFRQSITKIGNFLTVVEMASLK
jgi:CheY-like chemotaxis protein